ncbi:MAG: hypothetical protein M1823_003353 [Watsoniomyces obsoletus]|nr:MAG: hypothetical protein M1823_003353 [Watsoniomyces obsoletus]
MTEPRPLTSGSLDFGGQLDVLLSGETFPTLWTQAAISYGLLKQCLDRVQTELTGVGLPTHIVSELIDPPEPSQGTGSPSVPRSSIVYSIVEDPQGRSRPDLSLLVQKERGRIVDTGLSEATKEYLRQVAYTTTGSSNGVKSSDICLSESTSESEWDEQYESELASSQVDGAADTDPDAIEAISSTRWIRIQLTSDVEFFQKLIYNLATLDGLFEFERLFMTNQMMQIRDMVAHATTPCHRGAATEVKRWREIFELYRKASIFFRSTDEGQEAQTAPVAAKQLEWFKDQMNQQKLNRHFTVKSSADAFISFMGLQRGLLRCIKFQELNVMALYSILDEFDQRTALRIRDRFPASLVGRNLVGGCLAEAVCLEQAEYVLSLIPRLNDFLCPVCSKIAYKPIRLNCTHVICKPCIIAMKEGRIGWCPSCGAGGVLTANKDNIDRDLKHRMWWYFTAEVHAKRNADRTRSFVKFMGDMVLDES